MLQITPNITIADNEIEEQFIRAPGPGGQKVNKTESAVQLRFNARKSSALSNTVFLRLRRLAGQRMTHDGVIVIAANRFRTRELNRQDAKKRLIDLIRAAAVQPKHRRSTKPTKGSKRRRLDGKKRKGNLKKTRGRVTPSD